MNWLRATTDEKKEQRKDEIYQAAFSLFLEKGYIDVSFNQIAVQAGFTKSNVYRYYSSKEEIFLNIYLDLFKSWFKSLISHVNKLDVDTTPESFSKSVVKSFNKHENFLNLMPFLYVSLEKNSSFESLKFFKSFSKEIIDEFSASFTRVYPKLTDEEARFFLKTLNAFVTTFWSSSSYNEILSKVYEEKDYKALRPDFKKDLLKSVEALLTGILDKKNKK